MKRLRICRLVFFVVICVFGIIPEVLAFCGFYVAGADTQLYNQASQVAIARNGDQTVLTMASDYKGDVADFALVVPVPTILQPEQVQIVEFELLTRLDAYSAPRLVEYPAPSCQELIDLFFGLTTVSALDASGSEVTAQGVTVESSFTVGEYDIIILSAQESDGLETWLQQNNYQIPAGASEVLQPYIRQGMKFFVAKVNLAEFNEAGFQSLRPLQISYESRRFMLPIRLGMVNAEVEQDLIVYLLSSKGQTEVVNYRTVKVPTDINVPGFVENNFGEVYEAIFQKAHEEASSAVFLEYAWNLNVKCDPCSARELTLDELQNLGASWIRPSTDQWQLYEGDVFLTRLHVRYDRETFPEDLSFHATSNQASFQGRYIINRYTLLEDEAAEVAVADCAEQLIDNFQLIWGGPRSQDNPTGNDFSTDGYFRDQNYPIFTDTEDPIAYLNRPLAN